MKRKGIIAIIISVIVIIVAIIVTLASNKAKIDEANKPVNRSLIPVTVTVYKVKATDFTDKNTLPARLLPFEEANISAQTPGLISYLNIDLGSRVRKGEVVGAIDTKIAKLNLKSTLLSKNKLKDDYDRAKDLYNGNATTKVNLTTTRYNYENVSVQADLIRQQIKNANIVAPISGIITARNIRAGEITNAGSPIASVVNISKLKATVYVSESEVYFIKINQKVNVTSPIFPDKKLTGKVIYISPNGDENHNYQINIEINNSPEVLKAGTDINVSFNFETLHHQIVIPQKALVNDKEKPYVYVINGNTVSSRQVETGISQGENIIIEKGLSVGEEVVLSGQINLADGSKVNIVKQ